MLQTDVTNKFFDKNRQVILQHFLRKLVSAGSNSPIGLLN